MSNQKQKLTAWDKLMMAVTFAEAGDADTANSIMGRPDQKKEQRPNIKTEKRPEMKL